MKISIEEKDKCKNEISDLRKNTENNLKISIKILKQDLESLKQKIKVCNEEKIIITNKFEIQIKKIQKNCEESTDKSSKDCSSKNESFVREMELIKEKLNRIISEKTTEITEIRESKNECERNVEINKKDMKELKEKTLSIKNQLFICNSNSENMNSKEMTFKIKIEKLTKKITEYNIKIQTS